MYSDDIPKICSLCRFASAQGADGLYCEKKKCIVGAADDACKKYSYDILKRTVRRKKPLKTDFSAEDFEL